MAALRWRPVLILLCGAVVLSIAIGVRQGFGLFLPPISADRGWRPTDLALAIAVQQLVWGVSQPVFGIIADRWGTARVVLVGAVLFALGLVTMAEAGSPLVFGLGAGVLVGLGISACGFAVVLGAVARAAPDAWRSTFLGIASAGGSFGQFVFAPLGQGFIASFGWSDALLVLAAIGLSMALFAPPLAGRPRASAGGGSAGSLGAALAEAGRHRSYWLLNLGFFVCGFHVAFVATHLPGVVATCALPAAVGASALGLIGLFNIFGSYSAGVLGGRYPKKYLLSTIYFARAVAIAIFMLAPKTEASVLLLSAALGALWLGTVPLTSGLVGQIYGTRYLATLFGVVFLSHQVGGFFGAWLGGWAFERTGSYDAMWLLSIALGLFAGLVHLPIAERALRPQPA
jgi:MFS family permease